jgi:hypothetical protein
MLLRTSIPNKIAYPTTAVATAYLLALALLVSMLLQANQPGQGTAASSLWCIMHPRIHSAAGDSLWTNSSAWNPAHCAPYRS